MTDEWEEEDHDDEPIEDEDDGFGCLFPSECCMPGLHMTSECHTAADYEQAQQPIPSIGFDDVCGI